MKPVIVWFRQDLRLADHRALSAAVASGAPIIPCWILDDAAAGDWAMGAASRWWLDKSLAVLSARLETIGSRLVLRRGRAEKILPELAAECGADRVVAQGAVEPWAAAQENRVHDALKTFGVEMKRYAGALLKPPSALKTKAGEPFKVYTPFWRALQASEPPPTPLEAPHRLPPPSSWPSSDRLSDWGLHPTTPDWSAGFAETWTPGEDGAVARLDRFLREALSTYAEARNRPDQTGTSGLSPHLHFGEISVATCWHRARAAADELTARGIKADSGLETFLKELAWRDFSAHLLVHWPDLPQTPFRREFAAFPFRSDPVRLTAWQKGRTGYPIVDAGMRQLWHTGWMHNRVRMIVASFLVKHLLIDWREGEAWFWDTLVDADLASNSASWQWVAGCGADAAPYFRIFAPVKQGETFDPDGSYVRRWVPELARLPAALIHKPWEAPLEILRASGVELGKTYPRPIVDHQAARAEALAALATLKQPAG